ncbi:hypothetical protein [Streptomyces mirabilis]|uniref:hypothetical protein n=1 Tax=Streptomyces mirabilis TaxID=68239 RepID=UPI0033A758DC
MTHAEGWNRVAALLVANMIESALRGEASRDERESEDHCLASVAAGVDLPVD